jgi:hypothetical protein
VEYYSALKKEDFLAAATACMNLENIMLTEVRSYKRTNREEWTSWRHKVEWWLSGAREGKGSRFQFGKMTKF